MEHKAEIPNNAPDLLLMNRNRSENICPVFFTIPRSMGSLFFGCNSARPQLAFFPERPKRIGKMTKYPMTKARHNKINNSRKISGASVIQVKNPSMNPAIINKGVTPTIIFKPRLAES